MARSFDRAAASNVVEFDTVGQPFTSWTYGTEAVILQRTSTAQPPGHVLICCNNGSSSDGWNTVLNISHLWGSWNGVSNSFSTTTVTTLNEWFLLAITKATGNVAPVHHIFRWSTGAWLHETGTAQVDAPSAAVRPVRIGRGMAANTFFGGHLAALMIVNGSVMTNSEVERLPNGLWSRYPRRQTDLLIEFPSGRDPTVAGVGTSARALSSSMRSTTVTGTSKSSVRDPPGFRFSPQNRRR